MSNGTRTDISLRPFRISAGAAIALVFVIVGISFYIDPAIILRAPVGRQTEPWAHIWNGLYIVGGLAVLAGRFRRHRVLGAENLGVSLLGAGWLMNAIAAFYVQGFDLRSCTYLVWVWWAVSQYRALEGRP